MNDPKPDIAVELWTAKIPWIGRIAEHHWLVVCQNGQKDRWEVWQKRNQCPTAWNYLHLNLLPPSAGVGNGPGRLLKCWLGSEADKLAERIESAPSRYPWITNYRVVPGPNSNTFVQWVLESSYFLGWQGIGRSYASRAAYDTKLKF